MTTAAPQALAHLPLNQPARLEGRAWGLLYSGEAVRTDRWRPRWGRGLSSDLCFRLVLLMEPEDAPTPADLTDDRVVILLPAARAMRLRERRRGYAGVAPALEGEFIAAAGRGLETLPPVDLGALDSLHIFADALAQALYPEPPIGLGDVQEPLNLSQARLVWEGIALPGPQAQARAAAQRYGPGLGLSEGRIGPGPVVEAIVRAAREAGRAGAHLVALRLRLLREASLPPHLTTLYVLATALREEPPLDLVLAPGTHVPLLEGRLQVAERLTAHLLPAVEWNDGLEAALASLAPAGPATWRSARPYLHLLLGEERARERGQVAARFQARRAELAAARAQVGALGQEMEAHPDSLQPLVAAAQAEAILQAPRPREFLARLKETFPTILETAEAITALRRMEELARIAGAVRAAWRYLQGAVPTAEDAELALDREAVLGWMDLGALLASPTLWPGVEEAFEAYRARYVRRYLDAHAAYNHTLVILRQRLEGVAQEMRALERLNAIRGLGLPLAPELPGEFAALLQRTQPCPGQGLEAHLQETPRCPTCAFAASDEPPTEEVEILLRRLDRALRDQRRRLGSEAVRQVLARGGLDRLDRFLQAVQASDVAALTSLLDDRLVAFIEDLLRASDIRAPRLSILERLQERFPTVSLGEVDLAAAELARLLRQELEEAQRQVPDQPSVRVNLW